MVVQSCSRRRLVDINFNLHLESRSQGVVLVKEKKMEHEIRFGAGSHVGVAADVKTEPSQKAEDSPADLRQQRSGAFRWRHRDRTAETRHEFLLQGGWLTHTVFSRS